MLSESETKTEETDQVINSKDQSDSVDEIEAKVLANSVEKAIELYRKKWLLHGEVWDRIW